MLKNYLLVAWRNLLKYKVFSAINIFGLSLSLSVCLVLINLIYTHYQYDTFHHQAGDIYRIITSKKGSNGFFDAPYATSPLPLGLELMETESSVINYTNLSKDFEREVESADKILEVRSLFADERFFEVFDFEVVAGDRLTALSQPNSMVLKEEKAELLFPGKDPIGETLEWRGFGSFVVTAVVREPEVGTHLSFDALVSHVSMEALVSQGLMSDDGVWEDIWHNYNYLVLAPDVSADHLASRIQELANTHMELEDDNPGYDFHLQALVDIVPGRLMSNEIGFAIPGFMLLFFGLLGVIVIVTASLNYTNLFIARSVGRLKEIGIRKASGASRWQVVMQFLTESLMLVMLSLVGAVIVYKYLLTQFNELVIFNQFGLTLQDIPEAYILFVIFAATIGIVTGIGPSSLLSRVQVISSLRNRLQGSEARTSFFKLGWGRRTLTGLQFGLAVVVLLTVFILDDQARFYVDSEYGFDEEQVFQLSLQTHDPSTIKEVFSSIAGVENAALVSHHPAVGRSYGKDARLAMEDEPISLYYFGVDEAYIDVMGLELIAGSNFPSSVSESEKFIILNETAVERLAFENNSAAIGQSIIFGDSLRLTVQGVVKDYHWEPLMASIRPLGLRVTPERYQYAYFNIGTAQGMDTYSRFEETWQNFDPARDFQGGFLDEQLDELYRVFYDIGSILKLVGMLAITITALGFLGMIGYDLKTRTKEIGIRKVLGATLRSLLLTLGRSYLKILVFAFLIAAPAGVMINNLWVGQMAYHAPLDFSNIAPAIVIVLGTGLLALFSQVFLVHKENPTKALRSE